MVRVIAGEFRSRRLKTLDGTATRPTSDRLKETLFNLLQYRISGAAFLDCFAGSGSIGIEALSRGAAFVVFLESAPKAVHIIRKNLEALCLNGDSRCQLLSQPAEAGLKILGRAARKFDIVFLDPPYAAAAQYRQVMCQLQRVKLLEPEAVVVAEHSKFVHLPEEAMQLMKSRDIRQGDSVLTLYQLRA
jgi:16S rRNA (guanine(966)-N(2))-methyltransferase RsmD